MSKSMITLVAFSILLLIPIAAENAFANHTPRYTGTDGHCDLTINPPGPNVNYRNCNLTGADFSGIDFAFSQFGGADLSNADLSGATINGDLSLAKFNGANLGCPLNCVTLDFSSGFLADFSDHNLSGILIRSAQMGNAIFTGADLTGADLRTTNFDTTDFTNSNLAGADLTNSHISGAKFSGADLSGANLQSTRYNTNSINFGILGGTTCGTGTVLVGNQCEVDPAITAALDTCQGDLTAANLRIAQLEALLADDDEEDDEDD